MRQSSNLELEFIAMMASLMSIVALSIDALLPALPEIGEAIGTVDSSQNQQLVTMIFLGLGIGQLLFGPLSDSYGRKKIIYLGFGLFVIATLICVTTDNFHWMIFGRVLQGVGLSSPRTLSIAMVRDSFSGNYMAKVMSFIVMVFLLVPVVAPTLGQFLLRFYSWESIFYFNLIFGIAVMLWFWRRQQETLRDEHRIAFRLNIFKHGTIEFFRFKQALAYTLISGFITGSFMVYLSTAQQIFEQQYNRAEDFPLIFASLAIAIGLATYLNSQLVLRIGMFRLAYMALIAYVLISVLYIILYYNQTNPSLEVLVAFFALQFFAIGFLFGNLRSLAMQPLGHIAGIGAALNGFISTVMAVPIANYVGSYVDTTVMPLFVGFLIFGLLSLLIFIRLRLVHK